METRAAYPTKEKVEPKHEKFDNASVYQKLARLHNTLVDTNDNLKRTQCNVQASDDEKSGQAESKECLNHLIEKIELLAIEANNRSSRLREMIGAPEGE